MVNNSTNIAKQTTSSHPKALNRKKDHAIWRWKSRSWLGTDTDMCNFYFIPPFPGWKRSYIPL